LNEIGIFRGVSPEEAVAAPKQVPAGVKRLFSNTPLLPFEALRDVDFTLNLNADKLVGRNITIEKLDIDARLKNGRLHINPARLAYSAGFTEMDFSLDASGEVPRFALKIAGEDIDVDDVLAYAHEPVILSGSLNLADETLDVVINPQRKRAFFNRRSAVRINGSLRNPSAFTMPLAEAAEVYGTIVMPFVFLPLRALGNLWHLLTKDTEQTPCDLVEIK
jgi:hypothetical protein